jgi:hypothetical protein
VSGASVGEIRTNGDGVGDRDGTGVALEIRDTLTPPKTATATSATETTTATRSELSEAGRGGSGGGSPVTPSLRAA